jgi:hypothetical protein
VGICVARLFAVLLSVKILISGRPIQRSQSGYKPFSPTSLQRIGISRFSSQYYSDYVMSLVYGEPDPQSARASARRLTERGAEKSQQSNRTPARNATRVTAKRKTMGNEPAIHVVSEINTTRNCTPISDRSDEHGKRLESDSSSESAQSTTEISSMISSNV